MKKNSVRVLFSFAVCKIRPERRDTGLQHYSALKRVFPMKTKQNRIIPWRLAVLRDRSTYTARNLYFFSTLRTSMHVAIHLSIFNCFKF